MGLIFYYSQCKKRKKKSRLAKSFLRRETPINYKVSATFKEGNLFIKHGIRFREQCREKEGKYESICSLFFLSLDLN